jgi:hypothetical protein
MLLPISDSGVAHEDNQDGVQTLQEDHQERVPQHEPRTSECLLVT